MTVEEITLEQALTDAAEKRGAYHEAYTRVRFILDLNRAQTALAQEAQADCERHAQLALSQFLLNGSIEAVNVGGVWQISDGKA